MPQNNLQNWDYYMQTQSNRGNAQQIMIPSQHMIQMSNQQTHQTPTSQQSQPVITSPNEINQNTNQRANRQRPQKKRLKY